MNPRTYFDKFWRPALRPQVFVAMSFDATLQKVWEEIIAPAIRDTDLEPVRVDATHISGDILTQILDGIAHSRLVLGELSGVFVHARDVTRASPSANVMYEIGLAHVLRQEQEVLLVAASGSEIPFDISSARVQFYDPADPAQSRHVLSGLLKGALKEVDLTKHFKIESAVQSLDRGCLRFLKCYAGLDQFPKHTFAERAREIVETVMPEVQATMVEAERQNFVSREGAWYEWDKGHAVVHRLFDLGVIASVGDAQSTAGFLAWTPFGLALLKRLGLRA